MNIQPVLMEMKKGNLAIVSLIDLLNPLHGIIIRMRQYSSAFWLLPHPLIPVGTNTFYAWDRERGTYSNYSLIQSHPGSLFTYFFAHCWIKCNYSGSKNTGVRMFVSVVGAGPRACPDTGQPQELLGRDT
ncbi:MAG: hypothetical protein ABH870_00720 [bacterium]